MSPWSSYFLQKPILDALNDLGFQEPTKIQELTIPSAIRGNQDILGAAETVNIFYSFNFHWAIISLIKMVAA